MALLLAHRDRQAKLRADAIEDATGALPADGIDSPAPDDDRADVLTDSATMKR